MSLRSAHSTVTRCDITLVDRIHARPLADASGPLSPVFSTHVHSTHANGQAGMKGSPIALGIKGVFPLIKKHAPHCITPLATLDALPKATRLAIDATLLVQRLHFADDLHPARHLLGFHRLIRQLRDASLVPIMVFDNFSQGARLPAKMRENEKRKAKRSTLALRANVEALRGKRLKALAGVLSEWRAMEEGDRIKAVELLQAWKDDERSRRSRLRSDDRFDADDLQDVLNTDFAGPSRVRLGDADANANAFLAESGLAPSELAAFDDLAVAAAELDRNDFLIDSLPRQERTPASPVEPPQGMGPSAHNDAWFGVQEAESSSVLYMASRIHRLRRQYEILAPAGRAFALDPDDWDAHRVPPETPTQAQMTLAEGSVYERLQDGASDPGTDVGTLVGTSQTEDTATSLDTAKGQEGGEDGDDQLQLLVFNALTAKNVVMQRSYSRSSTLLSTGIFETCATLCSLLHVPVLWTGDGSRTGGRPHEGEALASMLVRNDLADAVVSEDSDVLLYGAPLIRGIMGHKGLEYIDSVRARQTLFPPSPELASEEGERESQKQMLDFALLCGTDFNRTVPGIGPLTALKLIREYKSIDGIRLESFRRKRASRAVKSAARDESMGKKTSKEVPFAMPDNLRWREYSKELNEARRVFENPPSLHWQAHKLRHHRPDEPIDHAAVRHFLRSNGIAPLEALNPPRDAAASTAAPAHTPSSGFGGSPFGDGSGPVASWSG